MRKRITGQRNIKAFVLIFSMLLLAGCGTENNSVTENNLAIEESTAIDSKASSADSIAADGETASAESIAIQSPEPSRQAMEAVSAPEEGYYSNEREEILSIEKEADDTYNIEYSIYKLTWVEKAEGIYDAESGSIHFSGTTSEGNILKGDIANQGEYLTVTITDWELSGFIGYTQEFYPAEEP